MSLIDKLGGRKFLITIIAMLIGTGVEVFTSKGISASFVALISALVGTYGVANTVLTHKGLSATKQAAQEPEQVPEPTEEEEEPETATAAAEVDLGPILAKLNEISAVQETHSTVLMNVGSTVTNTNKLLAAVMSRQS